MLMLQDGTIVTKIHLSHVVTFDGSILYTLAQAPLAWVASLRQRQGY
jgi:hypothetical protein